ncbi:Fanconi anemia group J protein homolog [Diachasmimorpha longicaudata]|uniref:Fanconi anemia group J protein homolog n=1 Tax=Diachasmimorpha longicaudata TaxID=58733 RepID=UPI0030B8CC05
METLELTSDDDSFEAPEFHSKIPVPNTAKSIKLTTSRQFQQVLISSDSSDDEKEGQTNASSLSKDNIPKMVSTYPPKIIGLGLEDTASIDFPLHAPAVGVHAHPQPSSHENSRPGPKRFFRWGTSEDNDPGNSTIKKRTPPSPNRNYTKKRNLEYESFEDTMIIQGNRDSCSKIDPNGECCVEDVGIPSPIITPHHRLEIAGVKVDFPLKPYPAQKAVMNALIKGCRNGEHALVESPTGSGKTLALLCGALAWQQQYAANYRIQMDAYIQTAFQPSFLENDSASHKGQEHGLYDKSRTDAKREPPKPVPKIFYGSRTHRQISQVTNELRRTAYRDTKMTILSSRDFTCIQTSDRNKTEMCNELLDPLKKTRCAYYNESNKHEISHYDSLAAMNFSIPFDIEDIVKLGNERGCCPYFAARNLMVEADLILCPYNYVIDPSIRKVMQINVKDNIVILDEAHNIEDICRDSGSSSYTAAEMQAVMEDCQECHKHFTKFMGDEPPFVEVCYYVCSQLKALIETMPNLRKREQNSNGPLYSTVWTGADFQEILNSFGISENMTLRFLTAVTQAVDHQIQVREEVAAGARFGVTLSMSSVKILERCQFTIEMLRSKDYCNDFRVFVKEATEWVPERRRAEMESSGVQPETIRTLECLCMNPGVIFSSLAQSARSIILASGTLAPIVSFASELGTTFKQILQNQHVISRDNVHIRVVPQGPQGVSLKAVYSNTSQWNFQDELGKVILEICESVPFGILCFLPSYSLLNTIFKRMQENGSLDRLKRVKVVFREPRGNVELNEVMKNYRHTIKDLTENPDGENNQRTGALLFAVFRGKVAEGIDFSDNEARAVITVGIPYAVRMDPAVDLKMQYNDQGREKKLMKGGDWYTIQAYRALNQALGRCIRHINDWGAILLVDERLMSPHCQGYLPKWVKAIWGMGPNHDIHTMGSELRAFVKKRTDADEIRKSGGV